MPWMLVALLVSALACAPAAAAPTGAPTHLRVAVMGDLDARAGAPYDEWLVRLIDPRTRQRVTVNVVRAPEGDYTVRGFSEGPGSFAREVAFGVETGGPPTWSGPRGSLTLERRGRALELSAAGEELIGDLRISSTRPGGAASNWRFGRDALRGPMDLSWSQPVARGVAEGNLVLKSDDGDIALDVRGWTASVERWWGRFSRYSGLYAYWETAVVHRARGVTWSVVGANRSDTTTGPGARDAQFLGVLVRTAPGRTRLCRPRIDRRGWLAYPGQPTVHDLLWARCGGRRLFLRRARDSSVQDDFLGYEVDDARVTSGRDGVGLLRQIGHGL